MSGKGVLVSFPYHRILVRDVTLCHNILKVPFLRCKQSTLASEGWHFTAALVTVAKSTTVCLNLFKCLFTI